MIDHFGVQAADVEASASWYLQVFAPLGFTEAVRIPTPDGPVIGFATDGPPAFWLSPLAPPADPAVGARENHFAFVAADRSAIDAVHAAAESAGAQVLHAPREWPEYHPGYYAVFLRDPNGHNVEAVCHG